MPTQKEMIREAMQAIAQRRSGRTKLVYDKAQKTIVAVSATDQPPRGLNISSEDADMFAPPSLQSHLIILMPTGHSLWTRASSPHSYPSGTKEMPIPFPR